MSFALLRPATAGHHITSSREVGRLLAGQATFQPCHGKNQNMNDCKPNASVPDFTLRRERTIFWNTCKPPWTCMAWQLLSPQAAVSPNVTIVPGCSSYITHTEATATCPSCLRVIRHPNSSCRKEDRDKCNLFDSGSSTHHAVRQSYRRCPARDIP